MNAANRKKLAAIKKKVLGGQWVELAKGSKDKDYSTALMYLGKAIASIEHDFGELD